jgi:hypothetical protein
MRKAWGGCGKASDYSPVQGLYGPVHLNRTACLQYADIGCVRRGVGAGKPLIIAQYRVCTNGFTRLRFKITIQRAFQFGINSS